MGRKINDKLIEKMINGEMASFLNYLKTEKNKFRLEVRCDGKCFVYYKKCKILNLGVQSAHIEKKYFENRKEPKNISWQLVNAPKNYFDENCKILDSWLVKHNKEEFETQQNIASYNQDKNDRFLIIDMEYNFSQKEVGHKNRIKKAGFDLLGIERKTGNIVFFEVKKGLKALRNKSGIKPHIEDFEEYLFGKNKSIFRKNLITDIYNIIEDKRKLGIIEKNDLPQIISKDNFDLIFVFEPTTAGERDEYLNIFKDELQKASSKKIYQTIYVEKSNYKLV